MKTKKILIFFFTILFLNFTSAITIQENTQFKPSDTNTTFIFGNNLSFDLVEVHSTYLKLDNNTIFANASAGSVNITIFNFTNTYKKWNETKSDSSSTISYVISNFSAGVSVLAEKNNVAWQAVTSNSTGYISFDYIGSSGLFELELGVMPVTAETTTSSSSGGGGYANYKPTQEQLKKGYEKSLRKNWKINFEFNNKTHLIMLDNIINKTATITVSSNPITFDLRVNETKKLDLNDNCFYDLEIFLKDITGISYWKKADLVVKLINEEIVEKENLELRAENLEEKGEKEEDEFNLWLWIFIGLMILLVIGILVWWEKKKRKRYFGF